MATAPASNSMFRVAVGVVANVAVVTSLLVYFGWQRSAVQSHELGISESLLGMSTRDYVLRSVRPVFVLVVCAAVCGLTWVWIDRRLRPRGAFAPEGVTASGARLLWILRGIAVVPLIAALLISLTWPRLGGVLVPGAIGVGILLAFYVTVLAPTDAGAARVSILRVETRTLCVGILVGACLFWTAGNYAKVEGMRLAERLECDAQDAHCPLFDLPRVLVYSKNRLSLARDTEAGVVEEEISDTSTDDFRFRYSSLRLLEHMGGKYFFVNEDWNNRGIVLILSDDDPTLRFEFLNF